MVKTTKHVATVLALVASAISIGGLLPVAFGVVGIAAALFPLGDAVFFIVMMGGPLLLLASGLQGIASRFSKRWFLLAFAAVLAIVGLALFGRFQDMGFCSTG